MKKKIIFLSTIIVTAVCITAVCVYECRFRSYPIDLVYLWVDGTDPAWHAKKEAALKQYSDTPRYGLGSERWRDRQELKYSLRSIEQYLPWVNHIYIVTDNQVPMWLNINHPKITIIDHRDILPPDALPTFNSMAIETALHRIPGLSEHFIYANDDCFVNQPLSPDFFFDKKGNPIVYVRQFTRLQFDALKQRHQNESWMKLWSTPHHLMQTRFHDNTILVDNHNMLGYRKSYLSEATRVFSAEFERTSHSRFRQDTDLSLMIVPLLDHFRKRNTILPNKHPPRQKCEYAGLEIYHNLKDLVSVSTCTFCLNDGPGLTPQDHERITRFMQARFPIPSSFEK